MAQFLHASRLSRMLGGRNMFSMFRPNRATRGFSAVKQKRPFKKLMAANRGEIAVRIFRAANELGIRTVGIYSTEDKKAIHRMKADESYLVGKGRLPVDAYLGIDEIVALAKETGCDAIHPGYGFLSERADFAKACEDNDIKFIGPTSEVCGKMGDKTAAREMALAANVPVVPGTEYAVTEISEAAKFAETHGYPIIFKAAYGGGGRGMRVVRNESELEEQFKSAFSEAVGAFGKGDLFIEKYLVDPKHIEIQIMGDGEDAIHLFERDCSVQRRHQKVIEIAPGPSVTPELRKRLCDDALRLVKSVGYENAGTVEFLIDAEGKHYFIEVNARLQVEHTVTEEVTGIDLMQTQIRVAEGNTLKDLGLRQEDIKLNGCAIQARVTTENPETGFTPDFGHLTVYRPGEGMGIRLDGSAYSGMHVTPHYDSLLVKVTGHGRTYADTIKKMRRSLGEFRFRGVKTNIPFIQNVLEHKDFQEGSFNTGFIEKVPELMVVKPPKDRVNKLLHFLSEVIVNGPVTSLGTPLQPSKYPAVVPKVKKTKNLRGFRDIYLEEGPHAFAKAVRDNPRCMITDTTWRDAHQSLLATRVRTLDMANIAEATQEYLAQAFSIEMWGGATFDVCLRFLKECPWDRIADLRELVPHTCFQMLLRGVNTVGYTNYPDNVVDEFCKVATQAGMDVFRVFDSLNYTPALFYGMDSVNKAGGIVEAAISYTGDVSNPDKKKYDLEYYLRLAEELVNHGTHVLCIKDMAGLLKPRSADMLVGALRKEFPDVPIHVHTHDTSGAAVASHLACAKAGADAVDVSVDALSGMTAQPSMGAFVASLQGCPEDTGIDMDHISQLSNYWEMVRNYYSPFEATSSMKSGSSDVFDHEIPGGQYTNLHFQAHSMGMAHRWGDIKKAYAAANRIVGDIVKVTPSSKVVGDLALHMINMGLSEQDVIDKAGEIPLPQLVISYFQGKMGQPYGGFPEPLRTKILEGAREKPVEGRAGDSMEPLDFVALRKSLEEKYPNRHFRHVDLVSAALYPAVFDDYVAFNEEFGDVDKIPTRNYFVPMDIGEEIEVEIENGKTATIQLKSIGATNPDTAEKELYFEINGQPRVVLMRDRKLAKKAGIRDKADPNKKEEVASPMAGKIHAVKVKEGQKVEKGDPLLVLSAMKMEMTVAAPCAGVVQKFDLKKGDSVAGGDLLAML